MRAKNSDASSNPGLAGEARMVNTPTYGSQSAAWALTWFVELNDKN